MSESRICPVCENDIPEDARFLCPYCHFELKWLDDSIAIEKAKQKFKGILYKFDDGSEERNQENNSEEEIGFDFTLIGILGGSLGFMLSAIFGQLSRNIFPQLVFTIILSVSVGYIWSTRIKRAPGCLFTTAIIIGIVAPVLLILILFPGGY